MINDDVPASKTWAIVLPAAVLPFFTALLYFVLFPNHPVARWIYGGTKIFTIIWPLLCAGLIEKTGLPNFKALARTSRDAWHLGLLTGVVIGGVFFLVMSTPLGAWIASNAERMRGKAVALGVLDHYLLFAFFLAVVHSFIEEFYWRWFVFGRLRRVLPGFAAHTAAAIAFAAHHVVIASQFFPSAAGLLLGALVGIGGFTWSKLYERQGSLFGAWLSHMIVDIALLAIGYRLLFG